MRKLATIMFLCSLPSTLSAQHGKAERGGLFTFPYHGDTWTGEIVDIDTNSGQITLQYTDKKDQTEKFVAKLTAGYKAYVMDHKEQKVSVLNPGDKIVAYYIAIGQKYPVKDAAGKKQDVAATENLIFQVEVVPPKKSKK
jgi:hypothetical protein